MSLWTYFLQPATLATRARNTPEKKCADWNTCSADSLITTEPEDVRVACMRTWRWRRTATENRLRNSRVFGYPEVFFPRVLFVPCLQHLCCELYITLYCNVYYNTLYVELNQSLVVVFFLTESEPAGEGSVSTVCAFHTMSGVWSGRNEANDFISYKCFMLYLWPRFSVQSHPCEYK